MSSRAVRPSPADPDLDEPGTAACLGPNATSPQHEAEVSESAFVASEQVPSGAEATGRPGRINAKGENGAVAGSDVNLVGSVAPLLPLKREALRDRVVKAIRDAIIEGRLRPGEKVPEGDLARQLTVSRTPIREAIRVLESQGLVEVTPKRGTYITMPDTADAEDGLSVRAALEILAVEQAIERSTETDWNNLFAELEKILSEMAEAVQEKDTIRAVERDIEFHAAVMRASKNRHLMRGWHTVGIPFLVWLPERQLYPGLPSNLVGRHREVLVALQSRNPEVCSQAIRTHMAEKIADITGG